MKNNLVSEFINLGSAVSGGKEFTAMKALTKLASVGFTRYGISAAITAQQELLVSASRPFFVASGAQVWCILDVNMNRSLLKSYLESSSIFLNISFSIQPIFPSHPT